MRDFLITVALLLLITAGFYAFQLLILGIVGLVIYWSIPVIRKLNTINSKGKSWR